MATSKKQILQSTDNNEEEVKESTSLDVKEETTIESEKTSETKEEEPVYIPDIPAQIIAHSMPELPKGETEIEFLQRLLHIQHTGGWGKHLDEVINGRIKELS